MTQCGVRYHFITFSPSLALPTQQLTHSSPQSHAAMHYQLPLISDYHAWIGGTHSVVLLSHTVGHSVWQAGPHG